MGCDPRAEEKQVGRILKVKIAGFGDGLDVANETRRKRTKMVMLKFQHLGGKG